MPAATNVTVIRDEIEYTIVLVTHVCPSCHIPYAMPKDLERRAQADGEIWFYCPNGHRAHYAEDDLDRAKAKLARVERQLATAREWGDREHDGRVAAERSAAAHKGQATRLRKRAQAGVCPVPECRRPFPNLAGHIKTKHPGWVEAEESREQ
jgi:hypothetical protein